MLSHTLIVVASLSAAYAWPRPSKQDLAWGPCDAEMNFTSAYPYECATLKVPLDYTNAGNGQRLDLALLRVKALNQPSKGSILFNPGGPGAPGTQLVASLAKEMQVILDGSYDMIGFDPRGTGNTIPFTCGIEPIAHQKQKRQDVRHQDIVDGIDVDELDEYTFAQLAEALEPMFEADQAIAEECAEAESETGEFVGTSFVARDMLEIVDALGQGPLLNYYGYSYGTMLGATFAAMFPERVGRVILEANVNVHQYMSGKDTKSRSDTDKVIEAFFEKCIEAGEDLCVLATEDQTPDSLADNLQALLDSLDEQPILLSDTENITSATVRNYIFSRTYSETRWPNLADSLNSLYNGSYQAFYNSTIPKDHDTYNKGVAAILGIKCGDSELRIEEVDELEDLIPQQLNVSRWFPLGMTEEALACGAWKLEAAGRYTGDFQVKTANPVLFINNLHDNITPHANAYNTSSGFEGSVVLSQNSYGHITSYTPSLCTTQAIRDYFLTGTLPKPDTVCEQDIPAFHEQDWEEVYKGLTTPGATTKLMKRSYSYEEIELLAAMKSLGEGLEIYHR